ncbi:MAG: Fur family transcriptional regulator [Bacteroidales bacterium]
MKDDSHFAKLLRDRKLKATPTRLKVMSSIFEYKKAMPMADIQKALRDFDRVTLYRTINVLMDNGIIHKALVDNNETYYAICNNKCSPSCHLHQHVHFKCTNCHTVTCVQTKSPITFAIPNHVIDSFDIEATGLCASCKNNSC